MSRVDELHIDLASYVHNIERARQMLTDVLDGLSDDHFHQRPALREWSVAECIEHLVVTAGAIAPKFEAAIEKGWKKNMVSNGPFKYSRLDIWLVDGVVDYPPKRRFKTAKVFAPSPEPPDRQKLVDNFEVEQQRITDFIYRSNGLNLKKVKVTSPVSSFIHISLGQYLRLVTGHQLRHLHQAADARRRVLSMTSLK